MTAAALYGASGTLNVVGIAGGAAGLIPTETAMYACAYGCIAFFLAACQSVWQARGTRPPRRTR